MRRLLATLIAGLAIAASGLPGAAAEPGAVRGAPEHGRTR